MAWRAPCQQAVGDFELNRTTTFDERRSRGHDRLKNLQPGSGILFPLVDESDFGIGSQQNSHRPRNITQHSNFVEEEVIIERDVIIDRDELTERTND